MGAQLANLVLAQWTHLSERPFRVLLRMALTALDTPSKDNPARIYRAGEDLLCMTLRSGLPDDPVAAKGVRRNVRKAVAELVELGAIEPIGTAHRGSRQGYRLKIGGPLQLVENTPVETVDNPPETPDDDERKGGRCDHQRVVALTPKGWSERTPKGGHSDHP